MQLHKSSLPPFYALVTLHYMDVLHLIHPLITLYKYELFAPNSAVRSGLRVQAYHQVVKAGGV